MQHMQATNAQAYPALLAAPLAAMRAGTLRPIPVAARPDGSYSFVFEPPAPWTAPDAPPAAGQQPTQPAYAGPSYTFDSAAVAAGSGGGGGDGGASSSGAADTQVAAAPAPALVPPPSLRRDNSTGYHGVARATGTERLSAGINGACVGLVQGLLVAGLAGLAALHACSPDPPPPLRIAWRSERQAPAPGPVRYPAAGGGGAGHRRALEAAARCAGAA